MAPSKPTLNAQQVKEIALRLLARREHSTDELQIKLLARGGAPDIVANALVELSTEGYLSEERFTENAVQVRLRTADGPLKIRAYLAQRGITEPLIKQYLTDNQKFWLVRAVDLDHLNCVKHGISEQEKTALEAWRKRSRLLKNRGYPANIIRQVLESRYDE